MARKKKQCNFMDENATKSGAIKFRINHRERVEIERLSNKLGISKSEVYRNAMREYYKKVFSDE